MFLASCNDDVDGSPAGGNLVLNVETGAADPAANTVTLHGTVSDMSSQAGYSVGFLYGSSEQSMSKSVTGTLDGTAVTATVTGLETGEVVWYKVFLKMGNDKLVRYGKAMSTMATTATVTTGEAAPDIFKATLKGACTNTTPDAKTGFVISGNIPDAGNLTAPVNRVTLNKWLRVLTPEPVADISVDQLGLVPNTTYFYAALVDLGEGQIYGDLKEFTTKQNTKTAITDLDAELVDLGLSTRWAKSNMSATKDCDFGGYFAFGDVTGVNISTDLGSDYPAGADQNIYRTPLDVAFQATGCMTLPTAAEWDELFARCPSKWEVDADGVPGYRFTGATEETKNNSIFLPAAGMRRTGEMLHSGTYGHYATGTANGTSCIGYEFAEGLPLHRESFHRFDGLSIRPVSSVKNIPFDKAKLVGKWKYDCFAGEKTGCKFGGPVYFAGKDVCWDYVTCGKPQGPGISGDLGWCPEIGDNTWIVNDVRNDYGTMELDAQGNVKITKRAICRWWGDFSSSTAEETGTYTVDESDKTIHFKDIDYLTCPNSSGRLIDGQRDLRIITLTDNTMQLGGRCDDGNGIVFNFVKAEEYEAFSQIVTVGLACANAWNMVDNLWTGKPTDDDFYDTPHTVKVELKDVPANGDPTQGMQVLLLQLNNYKKVIPGADIFVTGIKVDGKDKPFNANAFRYGPGDTGTGWRVSMWNGCGCHKDASTQFVNPFAKGTLTGGAINTDFTWSESLEVTFIILKASKDNEICIPYETDFMADGGTISKTEFAPSDILKVKYKGDRTGDDVYEVSSGDVDITYTGSSNGTGNWWIGSKDVVPAFLSYEVYTVESIEADNQALGSSDFNPAKVRYSLESQSTGGVKTRIALYNKWNGDICKDSPFGVFAADGNTNSSKPVFNTSLKIKLKASKEPFLNPFKSDDVDL